MRALLTSALALALGLVAAVAMGQQSIIPAPPTAIGDEPQTLPEAVERQFIPPDNATSPTRAEQRLEQRAQDRATRAADRQEAIHQRRETLLDGRDAVEGAGFGGIFLVLVPGLAQLMT